MNGSQRPSNSNPSTNSWLTSTRAAVKWNRTRVGSSNFTLHGAVIVNAWPQSGLSSTGFTVKKWTLALLIAQQMVASHSAERWKFAATLHSCTSLLIIKKAELRPLSTRASVLVKLLRSLLLREATKTLTQKLRSQSTRQACSLGPAGLTSRNSYFQRISTWPGSSTVLTLMCQHHITTPSSYSSAQSLSSWCALSFAACLTRMKVTMLHWLSLPKSTRQRQARAHQDPRNLTEGILYSEWMHNSSIVSLCWEFFIKRVSNTSINHSFNHFIHYFSNLSH